MSKPREIKMYTSSRGEEPAQRWWLAEQDQVHSHLCRIVKLIEANQKEQRSQDKRHAYLYSNRFNRAGQPQRNETFVTYNVVKSCVDTVTAKISQQELRPRVLTERGDWQKQQNAQKLTKFLDGLFHAQDVYRLGQLALRDAAIFGTGVVKIIAGDDKVSFERVLINELLVDDVEARYGKPKSLYQTRLVSRDTLKEMFPEHAGKIEFVEPGQDEEVSVRKNVVDMVRVFEGWHIGSKGRHVIAIEGCTLLDEVWKSDCFPFAFMRYLEKVDSFYGQGIPEELIGTQLEINKLLRDIQKAQHLIAAPKVLKERHSQVSQAHLTNEIGSVIDYTGTKPDFINPTAMNNEIYNHVKWLIQSAYEKVGVSQMSATSKKPSGLDSRPALREFANLESERFAVTEMNYQRFFQDLAERAIEWASEVYSDGVKIKTQDGKFIETISWKDAKLEKDSFTTKVYLSSLLPLSPAARLQKVEEFVKAGWMDRETALQQFNHPDLEAWETLETADKELVESMISDILQSGKYRAPEPEMDPEKAVNLARKAYLQALQSDASDDRLELLLRWIDAAASLLPDLSTPAVAPAMAAPQAVPEPMGTSPLLPQAQAPII